MLYNSHSLYTARLHCTVLCYHYIYTTEQDTSLYNRGHLKTSNYNCIGINHTRIMVSLVCNIIDNNITCIYGNMYVGTSLPGGQILWF